MKGKKTPSVVKLDKMIDEILYELMGRKDALQMLNEAKVSKTKTPIKEEYGLLAYPPSYNPSLNQIRSVIREVLEDQEKHDKVGQSISQMIDTLHLRSDIGTEYKEKINELTRRLKINGFRDYSYWEIANDRQRHIFSLSLVPEGFEEGESPEILYHYRTLLYVSAAIVFRHKSNFDLQFAKKQSFLMLKENGKWCFDLMQMIRSPFYSPLK